MCLQLCSSMKRFQLILIELLLYVIKLMLEWIMVFVDFLAFVNFDWPMDKIRVSIQYSFCLTTPLYSLSYVCSTIC